MSVCENLVLIVSAHMHLPIHANQWGQSRLIPCKLTGAGLYFVVFSNWWKRYAFSTLESMGSESNGTDLSCKLLN
jgi:hypothetical protein